MNLTLESTKKNPKMTTAHQTWREINHFGTEQGESGRDGTRTKGYLGDLMESWS